MTSHIFNFDLGDCLWNAWNSWSSCFNSTENFSILGLQTRKRTVLISGSEDGDLCEEKVPFETRKCLVISTGKLFSHNSYLTFTGLYFNHLQYYLRRLIFLDVASYFAPSKSGYCVEYTTIKTGARHEHCRCTSNNENIETCRIRCDNDYECIGYSYRSEGSKCYLYTTSTCSDGCNKRSTGRIGEMKEVTRDDESGCFIKKLGKLMFSKVVL